MRHISGRGCPETDESDFREYQRAAGVLKYLGVLWPHGRARGTRCVEGAGARVCAREFCSDRVRD